MKLIISIVILFVIAFFYKCKTHEISDKDAKQIALNIANNMDTNSLSLLKQYNFVQRGDYSFWEKISSNTTLFACGYKTNKDTNELKVTRPLNFRKYFETTFPFDTALYFQYNFYEKDGSIIRLIATDKKGNEHFVDTLILTKELFPTKNPFTFFAKLTSLKEKFRIVETAYYSDIGDILEIWLTPQYKIMFMPDSSTIIPSHKRNILRDFAQGIQLKNHWSLIKYID